MTTYVQLLSAGRTVVKGLWPRTAQGVTGEGPHSVSNEAIINGTSLILDILRLLCEHRQHECLQGIGFS